MKIATIIVHYTFRTMMLFTSISYFFNLMGEQPEPTGDLKTLIGRVYGLNTFFL